MLLLKELLALRKPIITESVQKSQDDSYTSPDGMMTITVVFSDPTEREACIWHKATTEQECENLYDQHRDWIYTVFDLYNVSPEDGQVTGDEQADGGINNYLEFPPEEYHEDGEEHPEA